MNRENAPLSTRILYNEQLKSKDTNFHNIFLLVIIKEKYMKFIATHAIILNQLSYILGIFITYIS